MALKVGVSGYDAMKARTMAVARSERRIARDERNVWFTVSGPVVKALSPGNRALLRVIAEQAPGSLDMLARITGTVNQPLPRTLHTRKGDRLVRPQRGERGRITPTAPHDRAHRDRELT